MLKVLVTGGGGFLGSMLVPALLYSDYKVTVLDNFMYGIPSLSGLCAHPNLTIVKGDIRDERIVDILLVEADIVIPLAALVGAPLCDADPEGARAINLVAPRIMLKMMSKQQRVLMPITNSGYGVGEPGTECTEESPLRPVSTYGKYKVQIEDALMQRENSISFRLATVFGMSPRPRLDLLVNDFVYRAYYDKAIVLFEGHFKRNYVHCQDVVKAFMMGLWRDDMLGNIYNVGLSSANLSKVELCQAIQKHIPNFVYMESAIGCDPDKRDYVVSNAKLEATGWAPSFSLDDGIRELIRGMPMLKKNQYANI